MRLTLIPFVLAALADPLSDAHARDIAVVLNVKPVLCITDRHSSSCEMSFLVAWRSDVAGDFCLFSDFESTPIDCWSGQADGSYAESRIVEEPFTYWITNGDSELRLAEATIDVLSTDADDRRRNRRNRHAWSVL